MSLNLRAMLVLAILFASFNASGQSAFRDAEQLFTVPQHYIVQHTQFAPVIDGNIDELVWQQAPWTNDFVDIEGAGKPKPALPTRVKMLWDDSCLYIAAYITEPGIWATLRRHDDIIFHDNDFEIFLTSNDTIQPYCEIEVNALNAIFDLLLDKPYRDGGTPVTSWDARGLRSAVKIHGTLNNAADKDEGWTVEMAIPFKAVSFGDHHRPQEEGSVWRINFSRVEWDTKVVNGQYVKLTDGGGKPMPEHNWVWSAQGVVNMHYPERWGYLQFSRHPADSTIFKLPYNEQQNQYLWLIYYREKQWYRLHGEYAVSLDQLGLKKDTGINKRKNTLELQATKYQFMALVTNDKTSTIYTINQDGFIRQLNARTNE